MRNRLFPIAVLVLGAVSGCSLPGAGPAAPATTEAVPPPAASTPAERIPRKSESAEPTSAPAAGDGVVVTGKGDSFRMVLPVKWKVAPKEGGLEQVAVTRGGVLKPNTEREQRNAAGYGAGAYVIAVRPAKSGGEPNVNIGNRPAGGVTDVGDLAGPGKSALKGLGATKVRSRTTSVGGDPALELRSRLQPGGIDLAITQYVVIRDDTAWIATVTEVADERSVAPQIAEGLDFSI